MLNKIFIGFILTSAFINIFNINNIINEQQIIKERIDTLQERLK